MTTIIESKEFYDPSGRFTGNETYNDSGVMIRKNHRVYDSQGRITSLEHYTAGPTGSTGTIIFKHESIYGNTAEGATADVNNYNKLITERTYSDGVNISTEITYTYCELGNILTKTVNGVCTTYCCEETICPETGVICKMKTRTIA